MKILVTGANGQLGHAIQLSLNKHKSVNKWIFADRNEFDVTWPEDKIESYLASNQIQVILNLAAYTNVNKAEDEPQKCQLVNTKFVENIQAIEWKPQFGKPWFIQLSTDYVFGGDENTPYKLNGLQIPLNIYGVSKFLAEKAIQNYILEHENPLIDFSIVRSSWIYSNSCNNFVMKIINNVLTLNEFNVTMTEIGSPTNAFELAEYLIDRIENNDRKALAHFSSLGAVSRYDLAVAIATYFGRPDSIKPTFDGSIPERPTYSVLGDNDNTKHWLPTLLNFLKTYFPL